ncbi:adipokinetic hormone/corazonin-related peptide receptor variant I-like isoform X2 [Tachypleus tridentatus]|uniref:adipokinetic hormone/corazonin-related peptide receptor variant I-like isoform X2 n=1 Tax=Tachypleus tridentatus TaxID=6853 RepID=UPI003FD49552
MQALVNTSVVVKMEEMNVTTEFTQNETLNKTNETLGLPEHLLFNEEIAGEIVAYSLLLVVAAVGNVSVFVTLLRTRQRKSRIKLMVLHLAIADLIVTFIMIPLEIGWRITMKWVAGDAACKIMQFLRAFGPYLSSMVLVCISLDRYFAILHPLKVNDAHRRSKIMLTFAWLISIMCSIPQCVLFKVQRHPDFPDYTQCVTFEFLSDPWQDQIYNVFCVLVLYGVPLIIIIYCYSKILWVITRRSRDSEGDLSQEQQFRGRLRLRRSDMSRIERARTRTLRMAITIVSAFFSCWTPYVVMVLWHQIDRESANKVDSKIQSSLFIFAVSNSCVNPLVYGSYAINFKHVFKTCFLAIICPRNSIRFGSRRMASINGGTRNTQFEPRDQCPPRAMAVTVDSTGTKPSSKLLVHHLNRPV